MENNVIEIVIFVAALIVSVIPKILKRQNDRQQKERPEDDNGQVVDHVDDPWDIFRESVDKPAEDNTVVSPIEVKQILDSESPLVDDLYYYESVKKKRNASDNDRVFGSVNLAGSTLNNAAKTYINQRNTLRGIAISSTPAIIGDISDGAIGNDVDMAGNNKPDSSPLYEVLGDLDMRKAVIYNEILATKFDE